MFTSLCLRRFLSTTSSGAASSGALEGIKILDLTRVLAGPFCTMLLGDLGAEVIKVERPDTGDETRLWGPPFVNGNLSCYFLAVNRNKKSIVIDLKQKEGVRLVSELAEKCDVLIENYVPGKLDKLGLGWQQMKRINSRLIYCSITGFGPTGPYSTRSGYDVIAASVGGLLSITGPQDGDPCRVGIAITDSATGLYAKSAILAALFNREKTGCGTKIDCDLLSTQVSLLINFGVNYINCGVKARRRGTAHESIVPYQSFQCKDGKWITIGAGSNQMFAALCNLLQVSNLASDSRFTTNQLRVANRDELIRLLSERFKQKTVTEWLQVLDGCGFPYGPVNDIDDVFADPQVVHNQCVIETAHPTAGSVKLLDHAVKYDAGDESSSLRMQQVHPPPALGQHTEEVLRDYLNYSQSAIDKLIKERVIQVSSQ